MTNMMLKTKLENMMVSRFPTGIIKSFAYGSAVFPQREDADPSKNMIDLVFVVEDTDKWHRENFKRNFDDYSYIRYLGSRFVSYFGNKSSPGIIYNPLINYDNLSFKYGVISKSAFFDDLNNWKYLYVAGRLHKPVLWLDNPDKDYSVKSIESEDISLSDTSCDTSTNQNIYRSNSNEILYPENLDSNFPITSPFFYHNSFGDKKRNHSNINELNSIDQAISINLQNALNVSLLIQPERFNELSLYYDICKLSYAGDIRTYFGIDKHKYCRIVDTNFEKFQALYRPYINNIPSEFLYRNKLTGNIVKDNHQRFQLMLINTLPKNLVLNMIKRLRIVNINDLKSVEANRICSVLQESVNSIVFRSSTLQTFKAAISTKFLKSIIYSKNKIKKAFISNFKYNQITSTSNSNKLK